MNIADINIEDYVNFDKLLDRETLIQIMESGKSLKGANLVGLDLT